jgi:hypothetical protein
MYLNYYFFEEVKLTHPICRKLTLYFFGKGTAKKKAWLVVHSCFGDGSFVGQGCPI